MLTLTVLQRKNLKARAHPLKPTVMIGNAGLTVSVLDEIARLVPGYTLDRVNLLGGNAVPTGPGFVPVAALNGAAESAQDVVVPAHDGLFTSATLGRFSPALKDLEQHQKHELAESAAD